MRYSLFNVRVDVIFFTNKKNKTSYDVLSIDECLIYIKYYLFIVLTDNQFDSGLAISLALLYAISNVKHVCP